MIQRLNRLNAFRAGPMWLLSAAITLGFAPVAWGMAELEEKDLGEVTGEGLSFPFENIRFQMAPTSFIELTGDAPAGGTLLKRGDVRYYGLAMSRGSTRTGVETYTIDNTGGVDWFGNGCTGGTFGLGCPMTSYGITNYSTVDNPYVLRVFNYNAVMPVGVPAAVGTAGTAGNLTVLEFLGPSNTDLFRWAFWGEIESDRGGATAATLQSQSIILGKPTAWLKPPSIIGTAPASNSQQGSIFRLFQYQGDQSFAMTYTNRLSGDFRFSVNQTAASPKVAKQVPEFSDQEGLYFHKVNAYLPLGQLNYQGLTLNDTQTGTGGVTTNGNFVIELSRITNTPGVYNDFYSLPTSGNGYDRVVANQVAHYYDTHGYVEWGTAFPNCTPVNCMDGTGVSTVKFAGAGGNTRDEVVKGTVTAGADLGGISFLSSSTTSTWTVLSNQNNTGSAVNTMSGINLGSTRIEGMLINHLKITSLGAN